MKYLFLLPLLLSCQHTQKPMPDFIEVHGHRGARALRPENTIAAFDYALSVGVDTLEFDVGVTKDNVLVVTHDQTLNPKICVDYKGREIKKETPIRSLTLKELKTYDCGTLKNPKFPKQRTRPGQKIPTLDEVFEMVKNSKHPAARKVQYNIETKMVPALTMYSPGPEAFAKMLVEAIEKHGLQSRVTIQSFDHRSIRAAKKINNTIKTSALIDESLPNLVALAKELNADVISPNVIWITKADVQALHNAGVKVVPWRANNQQEWDYLISIGVDGIISDDPKPLIQYLKSKNKH